MGENIIGERTAWLPSGSWIEPCVTITQDYLDLTLAAGEQIHFDRVTRGTGVVNARFQAGAVSGDLYGRSFILWNGNGWDLKTVNGWTFKFPDSGPDRGVRESSLLRIEAGSGPAFSIERSPSGDLRRAQAPDGSWIEFTSDSMRRIVLAKNNAGRTVQYEYDKAGRLTHFRDSEHNEEFYQYDPIHRLTAVLDVKGHPLLQNTYGFSGEITSQTLADGRKLIYEYGWDERRFPDYLEFTDPQGYVFRCSRTQNGYLWRLPVLRNKD